MAIALQIFFVLHVVLEIRKWVQRRGGRSQTNQSVSAKMG